MNLLFNIINDIYLFLFFIFAKHAKHFFFWGGGGRGGGVGGEGHDYYKLQGAFQCLIISKYFDLITNLQKHE